MLTHSNVLSLKHPQAFFSPLGLDSAVANAMATDIIWKFCMTENAGIAFLHRSVLQHRSASPSVWTIVMDLHKTGEN